MIYFNGTQFAAHLYKATYTNNADGGERIKYASDKSYWDEFVAKWGSNLTWSNVVLSAEQQSRLDLLNQQESCCGQWDAQASLFVEEGIIYKNDVPPYLESLLDEYGVEQEAQDISE